jgi:voltage-gated potassium channel
VRWVVLPIVLFGVLYYELFVSDRQPHLLIGIAFSAFLFLAFMSLIFIVWNSVVLMGTTKNITEIVFAFYALLFLLLITVSTYAILYEQFGLIQDGKGVVTDPQDFLYFSVITWTTTGFGDIAPNPGQSRLIAASEALFGYIAMGLYVSLVFHAMSRSR